MIIAIWNGFFGPSINAESDALSFHLKAIEYANGSSDMELNIGTFYTHILGFLYYFTFDHVFVGSLLSVLMWFFSGLYLIKIFRLLGMPKETQVVAVLIYSLLPSSILHNGITLREPFQMLFTTTACYSGLIIYKKRIKSYWAILFISCCGLALLHSALVASSIIILTATIMLTKLRRNSFSARSSYLKLGTFALLFIILIYQSMQFIDERVAYGIDLAVTEYQTNLIETSARTTYREEVALNGFFDVIRFVPIALFQYMFEPFPWKITTLPDVEHFFENLLRLYLIMRFFNLIKYLDPSAKTPAIYLFCIYILSEMVWSLGTANWGTSYRHHLPTLGILIASSFACTRPLMNNKQKKIRGL